MHSSHRQSQTLGHIPKQPCKETKLFFPPFFFAYSRRDLILHLSFLFERETARFTSYFSTHRSTWLLRIKLFVTSWKYFEMNLKSGVRNGWLPLCVVAGEGEEKQESEVSGVLCFLSQRWVQRAWQQTIKGQVMRKLWQQHKRNSKLNSISNFFGSFPCFNFSDLQKCIN